MSRWNILVCESLA